MPKQFDWQPNDAGFRAEMPDNVTLYVTPDRNKWGKPARGTTWRAGASVWNASTRTISRFGRDVYGQQVADKRAAMKLAESVYLEAVTVEA